MLDALGIAEAFVLGHVPGRVDRRAHGDARARRCKGILPLGTSMDSESQRSRDLGCWDGIAFCSPAIDALAAEVDDDWVIPGELVDAVLQEGLGDDVAPDERAFWHATYQQNYVGDAGAGGCGCAPINLRDRDGLHGRLDGVRCPVLWMHGTADKVYSVANAEDGIARFVNCPTPSCGRRGRAALPERLGPGRGQRGRRGVRPALDVTARGCGRRACAEARGGASVGSDDVEAMVSLAMRDDLLDRQRRGQPVRAVAR